MRRKLLCFTFLILASVQFILPFASLEAKENEYRWYLSLVAIFRDEADYLKEWIEYNRLIGVEHFFLYNNLSQDHYQEVLQPYVDEGIVELFEWPYEHGDQRLHQWLKIQTNAYRDAVKRAAWKSKWLVVVDTDEFIVPITHNSLTDLMQNLDKKDRKQDIGRYEISWVLFGTSGVERVPQNKLMIEMLDQNGGRSVFRKSIVRPEFTGSEYDPHFISLIDGKQVKKLSIRMAQINHYMYRDNYFLRTVKIPRRGKVGFSEKTVRKWESACCKIDQLSKKILKFIPELRKRMGFTETKGHHHGKDHA